MREGPRESWILLDAYAVKTARMKHPSLESLTRATDSGVEWLDRLLLYFLIGLVLILPVAHIQTVRSVLQISVLGFWGCRIYLTRSFNLRRTPLDIFILFYMITIVISFFTSLKLSSSLKAFKGEFLTNTVFFYMVVANINRKEQVKKIIAALLFGSTVMAVYGFIDFFLKGGSLLDIHYRAGSLHDGYESYAQYLIMVLPFNFLFVLRQKDISKKVILSLLFALNVFVLYLTHTRGAWLAFFFELLILFYTLFSGKVRIVLILLFIVCAAIGSYMLPEEVLWHGAKGLSAPEENYQKNTATIRLVMWKEAIKSFWANPFAAAGYGKVNFKRKFSDKIFMYEQAHNTFINTAVQLGVQGLAALLLIILVILKTTNSGWKRLGNSFGGLYFLGVFTMTIGFFIACQFAEFFIDDTARLFWILVGIAFSLYVGVNKDESFKNSVHPS